MVPAAVVRSRRATVLKFFLLAAWATAVIWRAWAGDDAFITLRTVDNALNGYGLRWNVIERVQAYTHPLWMFVLLAATFAIGSAYAAMMAVSIACSAAAASVVIWRLAGGPFAAVLAALLFGSSTAFLDYSTSGLENPLTHLLLALFVWTWMIPGARRTFWMAAIMAGLMLNRIDAGLLVLPAFLVAVNQRPRRPHLAAAAFGFIPLAAWEAFSVIYYGFPFPNTAYAKLSTGIPSLRLAAQSGYYYLDLIRTDTVTFAVIVAALLCVALGPRRVLWPLAAGIALYLLYIVRIGGDFMAGRFFAAPFFMAVIVLVSGSMPAARLVRIMVVVAILATRAALSAGPPNATRGHGINDQRLVYQDATRLITQHRAPVEQGIESRRGIALREKGVRVVEWGMVGMAGYFAGPTVHLVDPFALTDPLLARLPANPGSRIGHFERRVPPGYLESIRTGTNMIAYQRLRGYYDDIVLVTRGPIWSRARWEAILRLNTTNRTM